MKAGVYSLDEGEGECLVTWKRGYMSCQLLHRYAQHIMMNLCDSFNIQYLVVINLLIIIGKNSFKVLLE